MIGMNKISIDECKKFQKFLTTMSNKELLKIIKKFLDSEDVYYENSDETIGKYHQLFPLKHFDLNKLLKDNYSAVLISDANSEYIRITNCVSVFMIEIGPLYGKDYHFVWYCAHKHTWYDSIMLYDKLYEKFHHYMRQEKLERILYGN
jgi:hypothetical protein